MAGAVVVDFGNGLSLSAPILLIRAACGVLLNGFGNPTQELLFLEKPNRRRIPKKMYH
jgi:hypothetical protein